MPFPNEIYNNNGFTIRVIDGRTDAANKNPDGSFKRDPNGGFLYEYLTGPVGKLGRCKTLEGFIQCWGPLRPSDPSWFLPETGAPMTDLDKFLKYGEAGCTQP